MGMICTVSVNVHSHIHVTTLKPWCMGIFSRQQLLSPTNLTDISRMVVENISVTLKLDIMIFLCILIFVAAEHPWSVLSMLFDVDLVNNRTMLKLPIMTMIYNCRGTPL